MTKRIQIAGISLAEFQIIVRSSTHAELEAGTLLQKELRQTIGTTLPVCIQAERTERLIVFSPTPDMPQSGLTIAVRNGNLHLWSDGKLTDVLYQFLTKWVGWRYLHVDAAILKEGDVDLPEGFKIGRAHV